MRKLKGEQGAVTIIEATFTFPIVFFVVFFMIMAGEGYYQAARMEYRVTSAAISGAARCENPMLNQLLADGSVPTDPTKPDVMPYRYIFTGESKRIAEGIARDLKKSALDSKPLLFKGMSPQNVSVKVEPHMNIFVSSLPVDCSFEIPFPIRMIFSNENLKMRYHIRLNVSIGDPAELVRNVAMIGDMMERSEVATQIAGKVTDAMNKIGVYIN